MLGLQGKAQIKSGSALHLKFKFWPWILRWFLRSCPVTPLGPWHGTQVHSPDLWQLTIDAQCSHSHDQETIYCPFSSQGSNKLYLFPTKRSKNAELCCVCVDVAVSVKPFSKSTDNPGLNNRRVARSSVNRLEWQAKSGRAPQYTVTTYNMWLVLFAYHRIINL